MFILRIIFCTSYFVFVVVNYYEKNNIFVRFFFYFIIVDKICKKSGKSLECISVRKSKLL